MRKVLVLYEKPSSFVKRDIAILNQHYKVREIEYEGKKDMIKLTEGAATSDVLLSWFALGYATTAAFLSKILRRKSIIIAGGWDVVSMPEIGYGAMQSENRIEKTKYALKNSDKVLAVSESNKKDVLQWVDRDVDVVYHGFDPEEFKPSGEKENLIISVSAIGKDTIKLKGLDTFVKCAQAHPEFKFSVIGAHLDDSIGNLKSISPKNVEFPGYLSADELVSYYQRAKVYAQLSYQESFGCALAEAMLCGCVPVVTKRGALPEVVGDAGFYSDYANVEDASRRIKEALDSNMSENARERITSNFHINKRREKLVGTIGELLGD